MTLSRLLKFENITFCISYVVKVAADLRHSSRPSSSSPTSSNLGGFGIKLDQHRSQLGTDNLRNSLDPDMWRSWVSQRTGFSDADFEGNLFYIFRLSFLVVLSGSTEIFVIIIYRC